MAAMHTMAVWFLGGKQARAGRVPGAVELSTFEVAARNWRRCWSSCPATKHRTACSSPKSGPVVWKYRRTNKERHPLSPFRFPRSPNTRDLLCFRTWSHARVRRPGHVATVNLAISHSPRSQNIAGTALSHCHGHAGHTCHALASPHLRFQETVFVRLAALSSLLLSGSPSRKDISSSRPGTLARRIVSASLMLVMRRPPNSVVT